MNPTMSALAWTLIHFLWQGVILAALLWVALRLTRRASANVRYVVACSAMAMMLGSAVGTLCWLMGEGNPQVNSAALSPVPAIGAEPAVDTGPAGPTRTRIGQYLPWLVYLWMGGVLALSIRTGAGFVVAQRLKRRQATPLNGVWQERFVRLAQRLDVARTVHACESAIADVPAVIGWLRPVVLVPASALLSLPPADIEALLAHELAHVRRHDYLVNLFQTGVETLLFYHPAVWWAGQRIREEREHCCDDLAVAVCGDVLTYARALTRLEQLRDGTPALAMAANSGSLLERIRRLVQPQRAERTALSGDWMTGIAILICVTAICGASRVAGVTPALTQARPSVVFAADHKPSPAGAPVAQEAPVPEPPPDPPEPPDPPQPPQAPTPGGFIDGLNSEGFKNLDVDQLISFKIHGVTPEYIHKIKAAGLQPDADQLVSMRIHGVEPQQIAAFKAAGLSGLTIDDLVSLKIHGATPESVQALRAMGFSKLDADEVVSLQIHGVTPEYAKQVRALGLGEPSLDDLVSMKIHGVTPEFATEMKSINLRGLNLDALVDLRIHGVTPAFVRAAQKRGFKDLDVDKIVKLKQYNIFGDSEVF